MEKMTSNYFYVSYKKEMIDIQSLAGMIKEDGWMNRNTVIVNCFPVYSSVMSQILNHKLSHLNKNELYEQAILEMPFPSMSQVWNIQSLEYEGFDTYLKNWVVNNIQGSMQYLFVNAAPDKNIQKIRSQMNLTKVEYKLATLYMEEDAKFDYYIQKISPNNGRVLFEWENSNNPYYAAL